MPRNASNSSYLSQFSGRPVVAEEGLDDSSLVGVVDPSDAVHGYLQFPWIYPPPGFQPFDPVIAIPTPAIGAGEAVVVSIQCPIAFDGVVRYISCNYTGQNFIQGSGDLIWRVKLDGRPVKNYGNLVSEMGTISQPRTTFGIVFQSGQILQITITNVNQTPGAGTNIICSANGYYWPRDRRVATLW